MVWLPNIRDLQYYERQFSFSSTASTSPSQAEASQHQTLPAETSIGRNSPTNLTWQSPSCKVCRPLTRRLKTCGLRVIVGCVLAKNCLPMLIATCQALQAAEQEKQAKQVVCTSKKCAMTHFFLC